MKEENKKNCGSPLPREEITPAHEVLNEQGEIFSCGGVYLGMNPSPIPLEDHIEYLFFPNHQQDVMVMNHQKPYRVPARHCPEGVMAPQESSSSPESTLRRFFKESLN